MFLFNEPGEVEQQKTQEESHYLKQADALEMQILALVSADPVGAAKSWLGRNHIQRYGWMLENPLSDMGLCLCVQDEGEPLMFNLTHAPLCDKPHIFKPENEYPYRFELRDVLLHADEITMQLIAMEYYEDAGDLSPYTPEAVLIAQEPKGYDPFTTYQRPDVTVEIEETGERVNHNASMPLQDKPQQGFQEVNGGI